MSGDVRERRPTCDVCEDGDHEFCMDLACWCCGGVPGYLVRHIDRVAARTRALATRLGDHAVTWDLLEWAARLDSGARVVEAMLDELAAWRCA